MLSLADFSDASVVGLLSSTGVVFSRLHTIGVAVDAYKRDLPHIVTGALEIRTPPGLLDSSLAQFFPEVRQVLVSLLDSILGSHIRIVLDCEWVSHLLFPKVRGLVVHSGFPYHNVELRNLPEYVYAIVK